jgi:hypothetical protein
MKAFPTAVDNGHSGNQDGMDLRDYFAAKVMAASFCNPLEMSLGEMKDTAEAAYLMADAMMKVREK